MNKRYLFLLDNFTCLLSEFPPDIDNDDQYVSNINITEGSEPQMEAILNKLVAMTLERTVIDLQQPDRNLN